MTRAPIPGWEGLYEIDRDGRVWSLDRHVGTSGFGKRLVAGREMKPHRGGVRLSRGGRKFFVLIAKILILVFGGRHE